MSVTKTVYIVFVPLIIDIVSSSVTLNILSLSICIYCLPLSLPVPLIIPDISPLSLIYFFLYSFDCVFMLLSSVSKSVNWVSFCNIRFNSSLIFVNVFE